MALIAAPDTMATYLQTLCSSPDRHLGGSGNEAAVAFFERATKVNGFEVTHTAFDCFEWQDEFAELTFGDGRLSLHPGPYSPSCDVTGPLVTASTAEELEAAEATGKLLLLHGELVSEQLVPKGFVFFDPPGHRRIIRAIERQAPVAVIAATGHGTGFAGSLYPFPLIEDGDFDIPNAFVRDVDAAPVLARAGELAGLRMSSRRRPSVARQVTAAKGRSAAPRIVFMAHIDSKHGSPGALDNATGVAALIGLADLLRDYQGPHRVELVAINGEDDYSMAGEMVYLRENEGHWEEIVLGVNIDGAGSRDADTAISFYGCPDPVREIVNQVRSGHPRIVEGEPWFEGDHGLLIMNGRPAIAVTSANVRDLCATVTHSDRDRLELVDPARLEDLALFLRELVAGLRPLTR